MKPVSYLEIGLVIFLAIMILIPFGILSMVHPAQPFVPADETAVKTVLEKNGITILSEKNDTWTVPGAQGGMVYTITDRDGRETIVRTQTFASEGARDAAIRAWHAGHTGRGTVNGHLIVNGRQLVVITPADRPALTILATGIVPGS